MRMHNPPHPGELWQVEQQRKKLRVRKLSAA
jgi:hypothetical protein